MTGTGIDWTKTIWQNSGRAYGRPLPTIDIEATSPRHGGTGHRRRGSGRSAHQFSRLSLVFCHQRRHRGRSGTDFVRLAQAPSDPGRRCRKSAPTGVEVAEGRHDEWRHFPLGTAETPWFRFSAASPPHQDTQTAAPRFRFLTKLCRGEHCLPTRFFTLRKDTAVNQS